MIVSPDLNIESQFDFRYIYNQLSPEYMIEKRIEGQYLNYLKSQNELDYSDLYNNVNIPFNYPIHETIKDELEQEGLKVINFTRDDIDSLTSYEFEVESNNMDIDAIEYNVIKRLDLASKGITITVY